MGRNTDEFYNYFITGRLMEVNDNVGQNPGVETPVKERKPGRPRVIPTDLEPVVVERYLLGYGYRAISPILRNGYQINPHFSSVK
jgi:hypothetical protein